MQGHSSPPVAAHPRLLVDDRDAPIAVVNFVVATGRIVDIDLIADPAKTHRRD